MNYEQRTSLPSCRKPQTANRKPQTANRKPQLGAVLGALALLGPPAHAADGLITITGEITDTTCKIEGKEPPHNLLVTLPKISTSALKTAGQTAGSTLFTIKLTDCPASLSGKVSAYFEHGSTTDFDTDNLIAYTPSADVTAAAATLPASPGTVAQNVQIQIANTDGTQVKLGHPFAEQNSATFTLVNTSSSDTHKTATLRYLARYVKTGDSAISAGKIVSYVQYSIAYP
ncbi:fimbrial protein [Bordetella avium]|uniref:fimbrial protein n=1 Tax=Bordetella avium TaxID=521 RepID=UPI000FD8FFD6|nr:fimbrial protein [Bordetella avium]